MSLQIFVAKFCSGVFSHENLKCKISHWMNNYYKLGW